MCVQLFPHFGQVGVCSYLFTCWDLKGEIFITFLNCTVETGFFIRWRWKINSLSTRCYLSFGFVDENTGIFLHAESANVTILGFELLVDLYARTLNKTLGLPARLLFSKRRVREFKAARTAFLKKILNLHCSKWSHILSNFCVLGWRSVIGMKF